MKQKLFSLLLCGALVCSMTACGGKDDDTESATETDTDTEMLASTAYGLDIDACIISMADYENIPIELTGDYTVTDEIVESNLESLAAQMTSYTEVTDRTVIEDGDYVLVDYVGTLDGVAFDGGTAEQQYVLVAEDNGYIDGFTDGLLGQSVGSETAYEVTFPEDYGVDSLNGQTVTFSFTIYGIYTATTATADTLTDDMVYQNCYSYYGVSTVDELRDYIKSYLESSMSSSEYSDEVDFVKEYMIANSELDIPEEYLELRLDEYVSDALDDWDESTQTKWEYIEENYGNTYDELYDYVLQSVSTEIIFQKIAEEQGFTIDEDTMATYVSNLMSNYGFSTEDDLYAQFGSGIISEGKAYINKLYLINVALDYVVTENEANVTITEAEETTESTEEAE